MYDVLIIGSGGAALSAAIESNNLGAKVCVLSKTQATASQTCQAQGGINGVTTNTLDSATQHINDTLKSAHGLGDSNSIEFMCNEASSTIHWLDFIGVPFSKNNSNQIAQRKLGGASHPRACYSSDYTGLKILHTLYDQCVKHNIEFLNDYMVLNFIVSNNTAIGITSLHITTSEVKEIFAKTIIIATGGYAGIYHGFHTNSNSTTGDGIAAAMRAGCQVANMEYVQFHPTALLKSAILISESARGEGGYLVDQDGNRFIDELKPRDEVARAIYEKIEKNQSVYLDLRHLGKEKIIQAMPQEYELALQYANLYMDKDLIPIAPAAHYTMGGIKTDIDGKTNIKNLFSVGEASCNGVHGANRLGGNSLLEIITFGRRVGKCAATDSKYITSINTTQSKEYQDDCMAIQNILKYPNTINFYEIKSLLGKLFYQNVGLFRTQQNLESTLAQIKQWQKEYSLMGITDKSKLYNTELKEFIEFGNMLEISEAIVLSALARKESRGAHFRVDYPTENDLFAQSTLAYKTQDGILIELVK
ncbi:MAG: FAD-binding protein [Campylobacterales bacterium]|nr:FAD-binding protein [Campylobacterales bacterium]